MPKSAGSFKKGQSGNPGGLTKEVRQQRDALREYLRPHLLKTADAHIAVLDRVLADNKKLVHPNEWPKDWQKSADFVAERVAGKVTQQAEISGPDAGPIDLRSLPLETLLLALAATGGGGAGHAIEGTEPEEGEG